MAMKRRTLASAGDSFSDMDVVSDDPDHIADNIDDKKEKKKKAAPTLQKVLTRTITAIVMAFLYIGLLMSGHLYCLMAMALTQAEVYREIVNVRYVEARERSMPWFRTLQWAWFVIPMIYFYGETFHKFCMEHGQLVHITAFTSHLREIVFVLYWILFVSCILTMKTGLMRFQISQYMWSIVCVCLVVIQCKFFASNTLNGLFWFFFPMAVVMMNDVSAYFVGISCGGKFIKAPFFPILSPNKTWEGFIGAGLCTMVFSFCFSGFLAQYTWFTCPAEGLYIWPFPPALSCDPLPVFKATQLFSLGALGPFTSSALRIFSSFGYQTAENGVFIAPIQLHALVYGLFASLVAPFGGFFASAIKRAYGIKDFDSFMPGHGGMMDRVDCQLLMIPFTSFYYYTFIASKAPSVNKMIFLATLMTPENQQKLLERLSALLESGAQAAAGSAAAAAVQALGPS